VEKIVRSSVGNGLLPRRRDIVETQTDSKRFVSLLAGVFIIAFSVFVFEISLLSIYSVIVQYHMVFAVVSIAICGIGMGGFGVHALARRRPGLLSSSWFLFSLPSLFSVTIVLVIVLIFSLPLTSEWLFYMILSMVPFVFAGAFLSLIFMTHSAEGGKIYFADLAGASMGCLAVLLLLHYFGGIGAPLFLAPIAALGGAAVAYGSSKRVSMAASLVLSATLFVFFALNQQRKFIDLDFARMDPEVNTLSKTLHNPQLSRFQPVVIYSHWDAYARTDVVRWVYNDYMRELFINCGTQAAMAKFDGDWTKLGYLTKQLNFFPFYFSGGDHLLNIGSGGGFEVLQALLAGTREVTAVDINPGVVHTALRFSDYNGDIYRYANVHPVIDDGRSFTKRTEDRYDHILLSLTSTVANVRKGGLRCREDYLHSIDAFSDYLERLTNEGQISLITHEKIFLDKTLLTGIMALARRGMSEQDAARHIIGIINNQPDPSLGYRYLFMMRKTPYTEEEARAVLSLARELDFDPYFIPHVAENQPFGAIAKGESTVADLARLHPGNVEPSSDDKPFFFNEERKIPVEFTRLMLAVGALTVLFTGWVLLRTRRAGVSLSPYVAYFASLGIGFIVIENSLIQQFLLFLGYPTLSLSVIVFSLLVSGSLGSLASNLFLKERLSRNVGRIALAIALISFVYRWIIPPVMQAFLAEDIFVRSLISMAMISPLGFLMGMPFPTGVRLLGSRNADEVPTMWGINGLTSVLGAVGAMILAMTAGFAVTLLVGSLFYLWIGIFFPKLS
jgi:hypothetical protein